MNPATLPLDVLVIGAGQAGLAMGHQLRNSGRRFLLVDGHAHVGDSWRQRFDSLVLFTPRAYSALPGMALSGDPDGFPTKDELADYLEAYVTRFSLPVQTDTEVYRLDRQDDLFRATTSRRETILARAVVIATGAFQQPVIPVLSELISPDVSQLTPESYRNPGNVPPGTVLVVGDGATGRQIACELSGSHDVLLATGRTRKVTRDHILGRSVFWWMDRLGFVRMSPQSRIGRKLKAADPFPGKHLELDRLRERGVTVAGRLGQANGRTVTFASGERLDIDAVIWATGYRDRTEWVQVPGAVDAEGRFVEAWGVSPVPGLFFIGRSWQTSRGSALVTGVGRDAVEIAGRIDAALVRAPMPDSPPDMVATVA